MIRSQSHRRLDRRNFLRAGLTMLSSPAVLAGSGIIPARADTPGTFYVSPPAPDHTLRHFASRAGIRFGAALRSPILRQAPDFSPFYVAECSSLTPEWELKWESLTYGGESYNFTDCDLIIDLARRNGLAVRGHSLLWHLSTPAWAVQRMRETRDWGIVENHIRTVVSRYRDVIDHWDVVNEPIDASGPNGLRDNVFHEVYGPDYIEQAIRLTHEIAPNARLFINDFSLEYDFPEEHARRNALIGLAEHLLSRGVPLSGVGIQAHLDLRKGRISQRDVDTFLSRLEAMGLDISITELDVYEADRSLPIDQRDDLVAQTAREFLDVALAHASVKSLTTWGLSDRFSWLSEPPQGQPGNRGLLYDELWQAKPMRQAVVEALIG